MKSICIHPKSNIMNELCIHNVSQIYMLCLLCVPRGVLCVQTDVVFSFLFTFTVHALQNESSHESFCIWARLHLYHFMKINRYRSRKVNSACRG